MIVAQGVVGLQAPVAGSITEPGITVGIVVSMGSRPAEFVIVPDVRGMSLEEATATLEEAGLSGGQRRDLHVAGAGRVSSSPNCRRRRAR